MSVKSNPFVYPFVEFKDLTNKNFKDNIVERKQYSWSDIKQLLDRINFSKPTINGESVAEKILSIFLDDHYRFGPKEFIVYKAESWIEKFNYFIEQGKPLQFTLLGFPFKMPVPLKTNRTLPDMGELLIYKRLHKLIQLIEEVYKPGAQITLFTEGCFGPSVGVRLEEAEQYHFFLEKLLQKADWQDKLILKRLGDIEKEVTGFEEVYQSKIEEYEEAFKNSDPEFMKKYQGAYPAVFHNVNVKKYKMEILMDAYNEKFADNQLNSQAAKARDEIKKQTQYAIIRYYAYLKTRDHFNYIEQVVPHALTLSVSPKPNRLGIIPVNEAANCLPYHGVTVYHQNNDQFSIEYLVDLMRDSGRYKEVYYNQDKEKQPFFYIRA